jgi:predicted O-methyltransferase YrrM
MNLDELLVELENFGIENDRSKNEYHLRMLNITRDTGQFLEVLVKAARARRILEIGTSNGYSTLWLARAATAVGGRVTTIERSEYKFSLAKANFERAGLTGVIQQVQDEAGNVLSRVEEASIDFIFLDSERSAYPGWWQQLKRSLSQGGLVVVDNAISHQSELAPFMALVEVDPEFTTCLVPVGNGEFVAVRG